MAGVLAGRVALVTGAGRAGGMGEATARRLAEAGADVVVTDLARDRPELRQDPTHGLGDDMAALGTSARWIPRDSRHSHRSHPSGV